MANPELNRTKIVQRLEREGWSLARHGANHDVYSLKGRGTIILPRHRTLSVGVARQIATVAGW